MVALVGAGGKRTSAITATVLGVALAISLFSALPIEARGQPPRWDLDLLFLPLGPPTVTGEPRWLDGYGDLFIPGEDGELTFQLVNKDCSARAKKPHLREFKERWEDEMEQIIERLKLMNDTRLILNYSVRQENWVVYGERRLADWVIEILGYCIGSPIHIISAKAWFAWPGYGEAKSSSIILDTTLAAFDPIKYIFEDSMGGSTIVFAIPFHFPPDIRADDFSVQPSLTLTLRYPSGFEYDYTYSPAGKEGLWRVWGLSGASYGLFRLSPYRTFDIVIKDFEGGIPLEGAELVLNAHIYPYHLSIRTNSDGDAHIARLPDRYSYEVLVRYAPPLLGETVEVYRSSLTAIELATIREIRTNLYTVRVTPLDLQGRILEGAAVEIQTLEGLSGRVYLNHSSGGYASFYLIPTGLYRVSIEWKGLEVYNADKYIGYHPTLGFGKPNMVVQASVADLIIRAVDEGGRAVGAVFNVTGPSIETSFTELYRGDGVLVIKQLPLGEYIVRAANVSRVFDSAVSASVRAVPGEEALITLPLKSVTLMLVTMDGQPLPGAEIIFHRISLSSDIDGEASIAGVPAGSYSVRVSYRGVEVYSGTLRVLSVTSVKLEVRVLDLDIEVRDAVGAPLPVMWLVEGPGGVYGGEGARIRIYLIPDAPHTLTVKYLTSPDAEPIYSHEFLPSELRATGLLLPVGPARFKVVWSGGSPFEGVLKVGGTSYPISQGSSVTDRFRYGPLNITVTSRDGVVLLQRQVEHNGSEVIITIPQTSIAVRVIDVFSRPISGVSVALYSAKEPNYLAGAGVTGPDGAAYFQMIPAALAPYRAEVSLGQERQEVYTAGGLVTLRFNYIEILGNVIPASLVLMAIVGLVGAGIAGATVRRVSARTSLRRGRY